MQLTNAYLSSFRGKLFLNFLSLFFLMMVTSFILLRLMYNLERERKTQVDITQLKMELVELLDGDKDFLNDNYLDSEYYRTGHSEYLEDREDVIQNLTFRLDSIDQKIGLSRNEENEIAHVKSLIYDYNTTFRELSKKQLIRGFKDYGIEGRMRDYAHQLESEAEIRFKKDILMLRRHEKDYFLRRDFEYVKKLNFLISNLLTRLDSIGTSRAMAEKQLLNNYKEAFNDIVSLEREIGLTGNDGLRQELNYYSDWARITLSSIVDELNAQTLETQKNTTFFVATVAIIGLAITMIIAYLLINSISRPVVTLTQKMRAFDLEKTNKILPSDFKRKDLSSEMMVMMRAYNKMVDQIRNQVRQIELQSEELKLKNEDLKSLNQELDRFAYSVSHDLRSPITSIMGLINLVKMENPHLVETTYLNHISECVERLDKFIQNLLFYSKNAQELVQVDELNLERLLTDFKSTHLTDRIQNLNISFNSALFPIYTDAFRFEIIFQNILSNSIKYRDLEKPTTNISIFQTKKNGMSTIVITDNGIGIESKDLDRVFDLFYRSKNSEDGTGLGLYLVKKSIEKINGRIHISSEVGKGTRVTLLIPDLTLDGIKKEMLELAELV